MVSFTNVDMTGDIFPFLCDSVALAENRKKFAQLLNDYHDSMTQVDELKRQLVRLSVNPLPFNVAYKWKALCACMLSVLHC